MASLSAELIVNKAVTAFPLLSVSPASLAIHVTEILRWNPQLGLVSRRDPQAACERLILESLELLNTVREDGDSGEIWCVDVGSGGGFPGVVWALAQPGWRVLLVERKERKAGFLQALAVRLSLATVEVFAGPIEEAARQERFRGKFDIAVAVAVASPGEIGPRLEPMLGPGARFYGTVAAGSPVAPRVGKSLDLKRDARGQYGNYVAYHRTD